MSHYPFWAVLAPGKPARLERRARTLVMTEWDEESGREPPFKVIPGSGRYHAIVGMDPMDIGAEMQIAEELSLECDDPIYSIEQVSDTWTVFSFRGGMGKVEELAPGRLSRSLGCPLPGSEEPSPRMATMLRKVALAEGVRAQEAHRVLKEDAGGSLAPGHYRLEDTPGGLLIASGTGDVGFADITVSGRFAHATVYGVIASPDLDVFFVTVLRGGEGIKGFALPPDEFPPLPVVSEIKGECSPKQILAALGIPAEWFMNK